MSLEQEVELIRRFRIFSKLPPAKQKLLCFSSERLTYAAGQKLFEAGAVGDACYVVIEGTLEIWVTLPSGDPHVIAVMGSNEIVGEIAIFGNVPRTANATARTRLEVLRISAELFRSVIRENPDAAIELIRILAERLANTTAHLTTLSISAR